MGGDIKIAPIPVSESPSLEEIAVSTVSPSPVNHQDDNITTQLSISNNKMLEENYVEALKLFPQNNEQIRTTLPLSYLQLKQKTNELIQKQEK